MTIITLAEYADLIDPKFVSQTRVDENGEYYVVFESKGQQYKIKMKIDYKG